MLRDIGKRLKEAREKEGLEVVDVGEALDVRVQTIYGWEKGTFAPSKANLLKAAELYKVNAKWLLDGKGLRDAEGYSLDDGANASVTTPVDANLSQAGEEELSPQETLLLKTFRQLSEEERQKLLGNAHGLLIKHLEGEENHASFQSGSRS